MDSPHSPALKYCAHIDGLRALAVLAVVFFHADLGFLGGYVGVDVFFVISGYLITGLILKDVDAGRFSIVDFWERRVRRILPALAVVVAASLAAGWFLFTPLDFQELGQSVLAQVALVSNIFFWRQAGYFSQGTDLKPLLHTWSLAVEEQFYLLFPFLVMIVARLARRLLVPVILVGGGLSLGLCIYGSYTHPWGNFYLLPTRAWELLIGSLLAAWPVRRAPAGWLAEALGWAGLLAMLGAVFFYDRETRFPGVAALAPCVGAALVIWVNSRTLTSVGRLLAARPLVFVGLISYSLYLWHWPVIVFLKYWTLGEPPQEDRRAWFLLASAGLAILSWKFVETPFRQRALLRSRAGIFTAAGFAAGALLLVGLAIHRGAGFPSRVPAAALQFANAADDRASQAEVGLPDAQAGKFLELGTADQRQPVRLLVWGDSHAMAAMPVFDALCKEHAVRGVAAAHPQTLPLIGYQGRGKLALGEEFGAAVVDFVRRRRVADVILVAMWGGDPSEDDRVRRALPETVKALDAAGARVWIMRQVPQHRWNVPTALASTAIHGRDPGAIGLPLAEHRKEFRRQDPLFAGLAEKFPGVTILDPTELFVGPGEMCRVAEGGKALYWDDHHVTTTGAMRLRPLFEPVFAGMGKTPAPR